MTSDEVLKEKGQPIARNHSAWVYNSIDSAHDGVLTLSFSHPTRRRNGTGIVDRVHGPRSDERARRDTVSNSLKTADVIHKYGRPIATRPGSYDTTLMWFRNGVFIGARSDKVYRYGIFDVTRIGN
jgi:hypothetical protein